MAQDPYLSLAQKYLPGEDDDPYLAIAKRYIKEPLTKGQVARHVGGEFVRGATEVVQASRRGQEMLAERILPEPTLLDAIRGPMGMQGARYLWSKIKDAAPGLDPMQVTPEQLSEGVTDTLGLERQPSMADSFWGTKVPHGLGTSAAALGMSAPFGAVGGLAAAAGMGGITGATSQASMEYDRLLEETGDPDKAWTAFWWNLPIGSLEAVDVLIAGGLGKVAAPLAKAALARKITGIDKKLGGLLKESLLGGLLEGLQEGTSNVLQELVHSRLTEEDLSFLEALAKSTAEFPEGFKVGSVIGVLIGGGGATVRMATREPDHPARREVVERQLKAVEPREAVLRERVEPDEEMAPALEKLREGLGGQEVNLVTAGTEQERFLEERFKEIGLRVGWVQGKERLKLPGVSHKGVVLLDANASTEAQIDALMAHEAQHYLKGRAPEKAEEIRALIQEIDPEGYARAREEAVRLHEEAGVAYDAEDEALSTYIEDMPGYIGLRMRDPELLSRVFERDPGMARRMLDRLIRLLQKAGIKLRTSDQKALDEARSLLSLTEQERRLDPRDARRIADAFVGALEGLPKGERVAVEPEAAAVEEPVAQAEPAAAQPEATAAEAKPLPESERPAAALVERKAVANVSARVASDMEGRVLGVTVEPHDGSPEGIMRAAERAADRSWSEFPNQYNMASTNLATDEAGKVRWHIRPNMQFMSEVGPAEVTTEPEPKKLKQPSPTAPKQAEERDAGRFAVERGEAAEIQRQYEDLERDYLEGDPATKADAIRGITAIHRRAAESGVELKPSVAYYTALSETVADIGKRAVSRPSDRQKAQQPGEFAVQRPDTPEFRAWFRDSKVVNEKGEPLVVYHGTGVDFDVFSRGEQRRFGWGQGFHFSDSPGLAGVYADQWDKPGQSPRIIPVYLSIKNPAPESLYWQIQNKVTARGVAGLGLENAVEVRRELEAMGYDGIRYSHGDAGMAWTAFSPTQIKSATGNRGTFDPGNPDIRFAVAREGPESFGDQDFGYRLRMRRGGRLVSIGVFPTQERAEKVATSLEWSGDWKPEIERIDLDGARFAVARPGTPEFDEWIAESVIKSPVFHGSPVSGISDFRPHPHDETAIDGIAFSRYASVARKYSEPEFRGREGRGGVVYEAYVSAPSIPTIDSFYDKVEAHYGRPITEISSADKLQYARLAGVKALDTSAIGERGEVFVIDPSAVRVVGERPRFAVAREPGTIFDETRSDRLYSGIVNDLERIVQFEKAATEPVPGPETVEQALSLMPGRRFAESEKLDRFYIRPLKAMLRSSGVPPIESTPEKVSASDYLYALHAKQANAVGLERHPKKGPAQSGMSNEEADAILVKATDPVYAKLQDWNRRLNKLRLDTLEGGWLISPEERAAWETTFGPDYVPLRTAQDPMENLFPQKRGLGVSGKESMRREGRSTKADSPLAFALEASQHAIERKEANRVANMIASLAERNPGLPWRVESDANKIRENEDRLPFKVNGEQRWVVTDDKGLGEAFARLQNPDPGVLKVIDPILSWWHKVIIQWNPVFPLTNIPRDIGVATIRHAIHGDMKAAMSTWREALPAAKGAFQAIREEGAGGYWGDVYRKARDAGALIGWAQQFTFEERIKDFNKAVQPEGKARAFGQFMEDVNRAGELGTRLATFDALTKAGVPVSEAAMRARRVTADFARRGRWAGVYRRLYMFSGANVQGTSEMFASIAKNPSRAARVLGVLIGAGYMNYVMSSLLGDDDEMAKLTESDKARFFGVMIGDKRYGVASPYGFNVFPYLGWKIGEAVHGKFEPRKLAGHIVNASVDAFSPLPQASSVTQALTPTIARPFQEIAENRTFSGAPITPPQSPFDRAPPPHAEQFFKGVNPAARIIGQGLGRLTGGTATTPGEIDWSPEWIEHLAASATGGLGTFAGRTAEFARKVVTGDTEDLRLTDFPLVRPFIQQPPRGADARIFYDNLARIELAENQRKAGEAFDADVYRLRGRVRMAEKRIKVLRDRIDKSDDDAAKREMRERIREIQQQINAAFK